MFQVKSINIMGLSANSKSKFRNQGIPFKIKEIVASSKYVPTLYILTETKLKCNHQRIKLPRSLRYAGETSGITAKAGIFIFHDKSLIIENRKDNVVVITSQYAMYIKIKVFQKSYEFICVYLPSENKHCQKVLKDIDEFINRRNITNFTLIGDTNIDFSKTEHRSKARTFLKLAEKYHLINLVDKLNCSVEYSWRGRGERWNSKSLIDHCFTNIQDFRNIEYNFTSCSDHKSLSVSMNKKFVYAAPKWKSFLFKNPQFIEIMKKEITTFLFDNADLESKNQSINYYIESQDQIEIDLTFDGPQFKETSVLFCLLKQLKIAHDKFYSKLRMQTFKKTQEFHQRISKLYAELSVANKKDKLTEINILINQQNEYFKNASYIRAETSYLQKLILDGNSNSYTFSHVQRNFKQEPSLEINGQMTDSLPKIVDHLSDMHAEIVSPKNVPVSNLDDFLSEYDLNLDSLYPKIENLTSPNSTCKEFKSVIDSMASTSTPGISSEPKVLYQFLFNSIPSFMTKALNNLYHIDIENSPFAFIKDRNIVFIPKKGSDQSKAENRRPISLMETPFKIITKALNRKITPHLSSILSVDQHGFTNGRHMHNGSVSIIATMNHILTHNLNAQFVSFDIKRAFDRVLPNVLDKILNHIFPNGAFAQAWSKLTSGGRFRACIGNTVSKFKKIKLGTPQGGPHAGVSYNIVHHIFISVLNSAAFKSISLKIDNQPLPAGAFADDTWKFWCLKSISDVQKLHSLLTKMEKNTGLKINFSKTKILVHGSLSFSLDLIGSVQPQLKHLGIFISFDMATAANLTYTELIEKLEKKAMNNPLKSSYNILKRRNLCAALMNSMCFHVFRVYSPNNSQTKKIWKAIAKFLWSNKTENGPSYRYKISQKTVELNLINGGLNFLKPEQQSFSIFIPSLLHVLNHAQKYPKSTLGIILAFKKVNLKPLLNNFGYKSFNENQRRLKSLYPKFNEIYFIKYSEFLQDLEKHIFMQIPILSFSSITKPFNLREITNLENNNLNTIASVLEHRVIGDRVMLLPNICPNVIVALNSPILIDKLKSIIRSSQFPPLNTLKKASLQKIYKPLINISNFNPSVLALHFKIMHRNKFKKQAPAINTRIKDGLYFPDIESFEISFNKLFSLPITIYHKSFFFEQFTRTLVSKRKLYHFGHSESAKCLKCKIDSTSEHALLYCYFPKYFAHSLAIFLDQYYNNHNPEFIFLKESFYLFNIFYEQFSENEYYQLSTLILVAKDRALKISKDECIVKWNSNNCFSQSLFIVQLSIKLLDKMTSEFNLLSEFQNFLLRYQSNVSYFEI